MLITSAVGAKMGRLLQFPDPQDLTRQVHEPGVIKQSYWFVGVIHRERRIHFGLAWIYKPGEEFETTPLPRGLYFSSQHIHRP